ncbi:MAG TPA: hypothetical protein VJ938_06720, partial [Acidimicrobiia bacterium]|nr:hypothetical protein [Acidimicrobiia bacterium]
WILDIGQVDDTVVAVGSSPQGDRPVVYRADDLYGAWSEVRVGDLLPPVDQQQPRLWLNSAAVGPGGVAINFVGEGDASGGNPVGDILGRLIPGRADEEVAGRMTQASVLLVSRDLAAWNVVPGGDTGGAIDTLTFNPAGDLIATFSSFENGQAQRFSARATPSP